MFNKDYKVSSNSKTHKNCDFLRESGAGLSKLQPTWSSSWIITADI